MRTFLPTPWTGSAAWRGEALAGDTFGFTTEGPPTSPQAAALVGEDAQARQLAPAFPGHNGFPAPMVAAV